MSADYQIAVLGAGPGGYVAALKAAQMGARTALVEKSHLGGTCLNNGCIPSKTLLATSELAARMGDARALGIEMEGGFVIDWTAVQKRKDSVVRRLRGGVKSLLDGRGVTVYSGVARLDGPGRVAVEKPAGAGAETFTAEQIIVATGSEPARLPGWPDDPERVCTTDEALHWKTLPASVLIVGGGVIGCEFACMLEPLGVQVTVVEMLPSLLPEMDESLGAGLAAVLKKRAIALHTETRVEDLKLDDQGCLATLSNGATVRAERTLVAVGRRPSTAGLGLEGLGLALDRGFLRVDDTMRTSRRDVFCVGDANGRCLLAHAASAQGVAAVENALGANKPLTAPIPGAVYTFPEIAAVGLTTRQAREQNLPIAIGQFPLGHLGKAMAVNETDGFARVIRHRESGALLGVHLMGHNVTESIAAATALLHEKASVADMAEIVMAHPSISESLKEAAEDALGMAIHLPPRKILRMPAALDA